MNNLGRLTKVDLRKYWEREDDDFTKWLAQPDNLELLSDEIGIGIGSAQIEADVGRFRVDILAQEENTERKIIIENQLEFTDHSHLGQLITYAAGIEADYIIWIVRDVKEEHKQAVEWLNEHTDEKINFFLIAIELWQIGDSPPAPKFNIICRPNEWKKSIRPYPEDISETQTMQFEFWQQFKNYATNKKPELKLREPRPRHYYHIAIGHPHGFVALTLNIRENMVGCEFYIPDSKESFRSFYAKKGEIEKEINETLEWQELPEKKGSRIRILHPFNEKERERAFDWFINMTMKFKNVFKRERNGKGI
jgi:hypothetical protein